MAKSVAVKSGKTLSETELSNLINALFACKEPNFSPYNKPVFVTLTSEDLDKSFNYV